MTSGPALISVIIPCYNQAGFLAEAIESVLRQTYENVEIIVVDDGSTDNSALVAGRYERVHVVKQENQGLSAARNTGWRQSRGSFLVFLDADDRLLPAALELGAQYLVAHSACAFVAGGYLKITEDGSPLDAPVLPKVRGNYYRQFLRGNFIGMHAGVTYRRNAVEEFGGFDLSLPACEDYDLFLRITRVYPIYCHDHVVAEYRRHATNMSGNPEFMLHWTLATLRRQDRYVKEQDGLASALAEGVHRARLIYGDSLYKLWRLRLGERGVDGEGVRQAFRLALNWPFVSDRMRIVARQFKARLTARLGWPPRGWVTLGDLRRTAPIHRQPRNGIASYYSRSFMKIWLNDMEEETGKAAAICRDGGCVVATDDFAALEQFPSGEFERVVLPLSLQRAYDVAAAIETVHRILKPDGLLIATLPGIAPVETDADFWRFTASSAERLFGQKTWAELDVRGYGNVLAATAAIQGLCAQDLTDAELDTYDPDYQVVIGVRAHREPKPYP
jgi:glycosyltransferase involved in cell wall biosynthesis